MAYSKEVVSSELLNMGYQPLVLYSVPFDIKTTNYRTLKAYMYYLNDTNIQYLSDSNGFVRLNYDRIRKFEKGED